MNHFALTSTPLPAELFGTDPEVAIRALTSDERFVIEDFYFRKEKRVTIPDGTTGIVIDSTKWDKTGLTEFAKFIEFGLAILTVTGFKPVTFAGIINSSKCTDSIECRNPENQMPVQFSKGIVAGATNVWFREIFKARKATKDRMHITADRFVRYSRTQNTQDALLDLCICLESLLDATTEVSFRFRTCLSKVTRLSDAEDLSELLGDLYDLRSKLVHGIDATKLHRKLDPHLARLRLTSRTILTTYIMHLAEHPREHWKRHLQSCLFS